MFLRDDVATHEFLTRQRRFIVRVCIFKFVMKRVHVQAALRLALEVIITVRLFLAGSTRLLSRSQARNEKATERRVHGCT